MSEQPVYVILTPQRARDLDALLGNHVDTAEGMGKLFEAFGIDPAHAEHGAAMMRDLKTAVHEAIERAGAEY